MPAEEWDVFKMKQKKKPKKKSKDETLVLNVEQEAVVNALIQDLEELEPGDLPARIPDESHALRLIDTMPLKDNRPIPLLLALRENIDHGIWKRRLPLVSKPA